jgi:hypothetical protein
MIVLENKTDQYSRKQYQNNDNCDQIDMPKPLIVFLNLCFLTHSVGESEYETGVVTLKLFSSLYF